MDNKGSQVKWSKAAFIISVSPGEFMSEPMKEDLSEDFWQSFQQPRENRSFTQGDSCFALVVRDRVWKEGRKSWRVEMERGSRIWERYVHFLLFSLCFSQYKATVTPWVGLRKINVSYWCWEDMSPFTNTTLQWLPGEPSDAGFCGYLAEPASSGLKAQTCINPVNGSLCERPGGFT